MSWKSVLFGRRQRHIPIGIHWDSGGVMIAQIEPGTVDPNLEGPEAHAARPRLHALAFQPLNVDPHSDAYTPAVSRAIRSLVEHHAPAAKQAVLCVGPEELFVYTVRMPVMSPEELLHVVRREARDRLPCPLEQSELRHVVATTVRHDGEARQETIVLACHHDALARSIYIVEQAGLEPVAIDVQACAVLRCAASLPRSPSILEEEPGDDGGRRDHVADLEHGPLRIVVHVGKSCSTVAADVDGRLAFLKYIRVGSQHIDAAVAEAVELAPADARRIRLAIMQQPSPDLGNEVHRSILDAVNRQLETMAAELQLCLRHLKVTYRNHSWPVLWLSGTEATGWTARFLSLRLGQQVNLLAPFAAVRPPDPQIADSLPVRAVWSTVCGLALHPLATSVPLERETETQPALCASLP